MEPIQNKKSEPYRLCLRFRNFSSNCFFFNNIVTFYKDTKFKEGVTIHHVAYVHMRWTCSLCEGKDLIDCKVCKTKSTLQRAYGWSWYECKDPMTAFLHFITTEFNPKYKTILYAHFGSRFDAHFVLRTLYMHGHVPELIMNGQKIFEIGIHVNKNSLLFRDSYLITQTPLAGLPKAFGLSVQDKVDKLKF
jgi:hypothetical protein